MRTAKLLAIIALGAAGVAPAAQAMAGSPGDVVVQAQRRLADNQRAVYYGDLQLASAAGQKTLHRRIGNAIGSICDNRPAVAPIEELSYSANCTHVAWDSVRPQLDSILAGATMAQRTVPSMPVVALIISVP